MCKDFKEIWREPFAIGDKCKLRIFNFLFPIIATKELFEVVTWNDNDATAHDPLRMRITNIT
jgi:hypothetical protein